MIHNESPVLAETGEKEGISVFLCLGTDPERSIMQTPKRLQVHVFQQLESTYIISSNFANLMSNWETWFTMILQTLYPGTDTERHKLRGWRPDSNISSALTNEGRSLIYLMDVII